MRADLNRARPSGGWGWGNAMLPPPRVVFRVEQRGGSINEAGVWRDLWYAVSDDHSNAELANQKADAQRAQGFTVRVRPVVL